MIDDKDVARIFKTFPTLTLREQKIIKRRCGFYDGIPKSLLEVGTKFGITMNRVRQIEETAYSKILVAVNGICLELRVNVLNILESNDLKISDVEKMSKTEFLMLSGIGEGFLLEMERFLESRGKSFTDKSYNFDK